MRTHTSFAALAVGTLLLTGTATAVLADGPAYGRAAAQAPLVGTWNIVITPYICATGESIPAVAFPARLTFHANGTMTETPFNPAFQPGQRSIGMGYWERIGRTSYRAVFEAFVLFTSVVTPPETPFYQRGVQRVDQGIELLDNNHWTSAASVVFRDQNSSIVPPTGCMTAAAERLQ